ncbi:Arylsulfatase [Limihaloglobus sulfuriphilus]|uniref:Arylsulfatase n=1 Tax=Limihaloglobus sulfuriphilus TaxID=1851148 RepID=A0A1Q2ME67_9BACT|nr:sulfatase-like hydrolase/transferase [Limihaloglobus sulfuriphilus]AQQ71003.1 Arylsulfatase [Limihaloglobus sulfuriphilus]
MNNAKTNRRDFLASMSFSVAALAAGNTTVLARNNAAQTATNQTQNGSTDKKPNIIIIFSDQMRSFSLGCYGNRFVKTPNIDRLAESGLRFETAVSNSPTCVPGRSNLLSGQYCRTCVGARANEMTKGLGSDGLYGRNDRLKFPDITLAEVLKKSGYKTAEVGKWHIDTKPTLLGFDEVLTEGRKSEMGGKYLNQYADLESVKSYVKENKNEPFFLYYNILSPHMPIFHDVPEKYTQMYKPEKVPLRKNVLKDGRIAYDRRWFGIYTGGLPRYRKSGNDDLPPDFSLRELTALYYGAVTWVDDLIGELMSTLKAEGVEDNTIILFAADHGDLLGSHHLWNKARLYDEAVRIPMIFRWPAVIKKASVNKKQVASLVDVMPTLLSLCGEKIPETVQGQNLAPLLRGETDSLEQDYAFIETPYREAGIRTPKHLYGALVSEDDTAIMEDEYLFFDMEKDPYQTNNLAKTAGKSAIAKNLRQKLLEWDKNTPRLKGDHYKPWV